MKNSYILLSFFFSLIIYGQANSGYDLVDKKMGTIPLNSSTSIDAIAKYINANFKTEEDKIRATFYWTASNISYDVVNRFAVRIKQTPEERIAKTLKNKKGICCDYAAIFNTIAAMVGIKSVVISGYTKQNGKIATFSHAWCAAKINNKWAVFDPTWGSGALINGKFVKKINDYYFKAPPEKIIASHIPFDYLWQFLNYPITNGEFYEGKTQIDTSKKFFDFEKEIAKQSSLSETNQLLESADRIAKNGLKNALIVENYESKKKHFIFLRQNANIDKLNGIVNEINEAVVLLNYFISYKNNRFKPSLPDDEIINMIQKPREKLIKCQKDISTVGAPGAENADNLSDIKKSIESTLATAEYQTLFVQNYMSKSKMVRKTMFSKATYFGISLN
jgi:hypothetical protein